MLKDEERWGGLFPQTVFMEHLGAHWHERWGGRFGKGSSRGRSRMEEGQQKSERGVTFSQKRSSGHRRGGASKGRREPVPKTSLRKEPSSGVGGTV